jgi:hypothetical protein
MDHKQEESLPEGLADGNIDAFRKKEFLYRFAIDAWCQRPSLHARTFPTLILPLSPEEAEALIKAYRHYWATQRGSNSLSQETATYLDTIKERLAVAIKGFGTSGAFIKLTHRR